MELLKRLYSIHSKSGSEETLRNFVEKCCVNLGAEVSVDEGGNLYAKKGYSDTYPCVISHLDQVQTKHSGDFRALVVGDVVFGFSESSREQQGLGADDKNGIWVCLRCLERFDAIKVAFFVGEETGCVGSSQADMNFFTDCRFVIQCDRRGSSDFISSIYSTELCSEEFLNDIHMEDFGYSKTSGMLTDSYTLKKNGLGVSCCNMSCGYYNAHSDSEITVLSELQNCLDFVTSIIRNCVRVYTHQYVAPKYDYGSLRDYDSYSVYDCYRNNRHNSSYYNKGYSRSYYGSGKSVQTVPSKFSLKDEEELIADDMRNEIWELLYGYPEITFSEYWKDYGEYHGLKKRRTRKIFNSTKKEFLEFNGDFYDYDNVCAVG